MSLWTQCVLWLKGLFIAEPGTRTKMVTMLASMILMASSLSHGNLRKEPASDEPMDTQTVVDIDDYKHYDNCDTPGECSAPCADPQIFELRMCSSWMCNLCSSAYCSKSCTEVQSEFPTCRCKDWPADKKSYTQSIL